MSGKPDIKELLKKVDFDRVLSMLKGRWVPIVCGIVIVAAPLTAWLLLDMVRQPIVSELKRRSDAFDKLASLEKTPVEVKKADGAAASESVTLNEEIIRRVAAHNRTLGGGAEAIYEAAVRRNRGCGDLVECKTFRHTLTPGLEAVLPAPKDASQRDVAILRESEFSALEKAREAKMKSFGTDTAPKPSAVLEHVQRAEQEYLAGTLRKRSRGEVTDPKELEALNLHLVDARKEFLGQHAAQLSFYLDPWAVNWPTIAAPSGDKANEAAAYDRALATLFQYQWDLWLVDDVLSAIRRVNDEGASGGSAALRGPMVAPVKRVVQLSVTPIGQVAAPSGDAAAGGEAPADAAAGPTGEAIDAKAAVTPDFTVSITGLKSNQLFDVRTATLRVVVETAAIPRLIDALARQNFISVTSIAMTPADAFAAARQGFVYGPQPCSDVTLTLESVWFREWVTERMPTAMRKALNTAGPAAKEPAAGETPPAEGGTKG